jgi:hypothetical protein
MVTELIVGGLYQHYKGNKYKLLSLVRHSETLEWLVFYECLYENPAGRLWVRPKAMFAEMVEVNGEMVPRFKYLGTFSEEGA